MQDMYTAKANSPTTSLSVNITAAQTTIQVANANVLPAGPNLCTIGVGDAAETIKYTSITGNNLVGVTRSFEGAANAWSAGTQVGRYFTAYDHDAFKSNIATLSTEKASKAYVDSQITLITETGIPKLNVYEYKFDNVSIDTTEIEIPLDTFDKTTDTLKLYVNAIPRDSDFYTIADSVPGISGSKVMLNRGLTSVSKVTLEVWKNIPAGETGTVSGLVIAPDTLPMDRVVDLEYTLNDIRTSTVSYNNNITDTTLPNSLSLNQGVTITTIVTGGHAFPTIPEAGTLITYKTNNDYAVQDFTTTTGVRYIRRGRATVWDPWTRQTTFEEAQGIVSTLSEYMMQTFATKSSFNTHVAEDVIQVKNITRDLQIAGVQTIVFDRPVKGMLALGAVNNTDMMNVGVMSKDNAGLITKIGTFYNFSNQILLFQTAGTINYSSAMIALDGNNVNISWVKTLDGTVGTANVTLVAFF